MPAPETTVLQVNFKTAGDSLINVYAATPEQFDAALDFLATRIGKIAEVESSAKGAAVLAQAMQVTEVQQAPPPAAPAPPTSGGWGAPAPAQQTYGQPTVPVCVHGVRKAVKGNGAKGEWRAYMCPTPKGTPNQCDPVWLKQGSPEWNAFSA